MDEIINYLTTVLQTKPEHFTNEHVEKLKQSLNEFMKTGAKIEVENLLTEFEKKHADLINAKLQAAKIQDFKTAAKWRDEYREYLLLYLSGENKYETKKSFVQQNENNLHYVYLGENNQQAALLLKIISDFNNVEQKGQTDEIPPHSPMSAGEMFEYLNRVLETDASQFSDLKAAELRLELKSFINAGAKIEVENLEKEFESKHADLIEGKINAIKSNNFPLAAEYRDRYFEVFLDFLDGNNKYNLKYSILKLDKSNLQYIYLGEDNKQAALLLKTIEEAKNQSAPKPVPEIKSVEKILPHDGHADTLPKAIIENINKLLSKELNYAKNPHPETGQIHDYLEEQFAILSEQGFHLFLIDETPKRDPKNISAFSIPKATRKSYFRIIDKTKIAFVKCDEYDHISNLVFGALLKFIFAKDEKVLFETTTGAFLPKNLMQRQRYKGLHVRYIKIENNKIIFGNTHFGNTKLVNELKAKNRILNYVYYADMPKDDIFSIGKTVVLLFLLIGGETGMPTKHLHYLYNKLSENNFSDDPFKDIIDFLKYETKIKDDKIYLKPTTNAELSFYIGLSYELVISVNNLFRKLIDKDDTTILIQYLPHYFQYDILSYFNDEQQAELADNYFFNYFSYKIISIKDYKSNDNQSIEKEFLEKAEKYPQIKQADTAKLIGRYYFTLQEFETACKVFEMIYLKDVIAEEFLGIEKLNEFINLILYLDSAIKTNRLPFAEILIDKLIRSASKSITVTSSPAINVAFTLFWYQLKMMKISVYILAEKPDMALKTFEELINLKKQSENDELAPNENYNLHTINTFPVYTQIDQNKTRLQLYHWIVDSLLAKLKISGKTNSELNDKYRNITQDYATLSEKLPYFDPNARKLQDYLIDPVFYIEIQE